VVAKQKRKKYTDTYIHNYTYTQIWA